MSTGARQNPRSTLWTPGRRGVLAAGAALAGTGLTAACGGGDSGGGDASLRASWYGGAPVNDAMKAATAAFTTANPETSVSTEFAAFADYWDKLATQTAGGTGPDVFRMSMSYFAQYAQRGALLDLTDAVPGTIDTSTLDEGVAGSGEIADGLYGIGQSSITHAVFTDTTALQAVGATPPATGWTWQEFGEFARSYASSTPDGVWGTQDAGGAVQIFEVYSRQNGSPVFADDGTLATSEDLIAQWLDMWDQLRRDGAAPPGDVTSEASAFETSVLVTGKAPVLFGWVQQITFYQPLTDHVVDIVGVPAGDGGPLEGQFVKALDLWTIAASTKNPDAAQALVNFLVNDEAAIKAIGVTLGVPPSQQARDLLAADPTSATGKCIAFVEDAQDQVGPSPAAWPAGYSDFSDAFARANEDIAFGKATPSQAAAALVETAQGALGS